ncbi:MAG: prepilin-type N-terminal cleavage/methylation domain-containing protein [Oscillospiraceae bacterium]|nr:prepilin-type N-terminal cleavage/methylation domain-containing protein [Oscillospiraceae bacterium]
MKRKLSGMTLAEIMAALTILVLVSAFAYAGISTAANFMRRGSDISQERCTAQNKLEDKIFSAHNDDTFSDYEGTSVECVIDAKTSIRLNAKKIVSDNSSDYSYTYYAGTH